MALLSVTPHAPGKGSSVWEEGGRRLQAEVNIDIMVFTL